MTFDEYIDVERFEDAVPSWIDAHSLLDVCRTVWDDSRALHDGLPDGWADAPPPDGSFFYARHDRMNATMTFRVGDNLFYFGEDILEDGRPLSDMPDSTEYWGPLPNPEDHT